MKFIANLLINISNNTIPLAYIIFILGIIGSLIKGFGKIKKLNNNLILKEIAPKVKEIKEQYIDEDEQLKHLNKLYKTHHFSALTPVIANIISVIMYMFLFLTVISSNNFVIENCLKPINFFTIENIFTKNILIIIPIIIIILKIISLYAFIPKELINKKEIAITIISNILTTAIFCNLLITSYAVFKLGLTIGETLLSFYYNKKRREIYYKYPPQPKEEILPDLNEQTEKPPKKSFKELIKDLEKTIDEELFKKK